MLTSMSRIIGCFTVSVSTLFAIACSKEGGQRTSGRRDCLWVNAGMFWGIWSDI